MRQISNSRSKREKMCAICGLRCATGMVVNLNSSSATLELGRRHGRERGDFRELLMSS